MSIHVYTRPSETHEAVGEQKFGTISMVDLMGEVIEPR